MTLYYGNSAIFLIMGNAGFISSTVLSLVFWLPTRQAGNHRAKGLQNRALHAGGKRLSGRPLSSINIGALMIRIVLWGTVYYTCNKGPPK